MCILIVPTSHIASQSMRDIRKAIETHNPDIVAVELDIHRFMMMEHEEKSSAIDFIRTAGPLNFLLFFIMKKLQTWLGKAVNVLPGSDMLTAIKIAEERGIEVAFIDRDINHTVFRISSAPRREKLKLIWFLLKGLLAGTLFSRFSKQKIDLTKVPPENMIRESMKMLKKEFPHIYKALVTERDSHMSRKLRELSETEHYKKIVAVIGAGHRQGLTRRLRHLLCQEQKSRSL